MRKRDVVETTTARGAGVAEGGAEASASGTNPEKLRGFARPADVRLGCPPL